MTVEELQAAFPPSKDIIYRDDDAIIRGLKATSDCPATAHVDLQDGMVRSVIFAGESEPLTHCLRGVRNALTSRYGKPKRIRGARYLWRTPVVEITLGSQPADVPTWVESMTASHEWIVCIEPSSELSMPGS